LRHGGSSVSAFANLLKKCAKDTSGFDFLQLLRRARLHVGHRTAGLMGADGLFTFDTFPSRDNRSNATSMVGALASGCSQWTNDASSHHRSSLGIAFRCTPLLRNPRIASRLSHTVDVQKANDPSLVTQPVRNPGDRRACFEDASA